MAWFGQKRVPGRKRRATQETVAEPRPLVLCADDFALAEGVSEGIIMLAEAGRLSAIGCMTASPLWPRLAVELDRVATAATSACT